MKILGIETSCDETAAAVYDNEEGLQSNILYSQIAAHEKFGGVVPELASRLHIAHITSIVEQALQAAQTSLADITAIAVTTGPGLPGSLLVGLCFAKGLAYTQSCHLIGINHIEGHIFSTHIEHEIPFPYLCLVASGGHTSLFLVHGYGAYQLLCETSDDAAGEAFDKVAKLIGLTYPGGPRIEQLAQEGEFRDYRLYPRLKNKTLSFSFSGLKTAVLYDLIKTGAYDLSTKTILTNDHQLRVEVASSLLVAIGDIFLDRITLACTEHQVQAITFVGGVACNKYLRNLLSSFAVSQGYYFATPSPSLCTDNAAMIAFVGNYKAKQGLFADLSLDICAQKSR